MTAIKYQGITSSENCLIAADGTQIAFPTVLFFLVTQVRNCEDESRILNDLHRITLLQRKVLVRIMWITWIAAHRRMMDLSGLIVLVKVAE
ncbi:hypothetical protein T12_1380 [Trichinella patagoniensis]|uniref:Uncharacterized protein n=1 Tax=Trichinella patagoniensis TaxID=990121 RepID=A0A0V0Z4Y3_9BILA|nr:hypothetical protein T12_1380 [Trichinella patagoniensis]